MGYGWVTRNYRLLDYATQGYAVFVALLALVFHNARTPRWGWIVGAHVVGVVLVHGLIARHASGRGGRVVAFLRHLYPVLLFVGFFREIGELNRMFATGYWDPAIIRWEARWFGGQPSLEWMERWPYRWVGELLYGAYFSYYAMIAGIGVTLYMRRREAFAHFMTVVSLVFYACYTFYLFCPVIGPRAFYQDWGALGFPAEILPAQVPPVPEAVAAGWFFGVMRIIYELFETQGAAFPSSHVAIAVVTLYFSIRYLPRIAWVHGVAVVLLCISTVYCRYHYLVDVFAGLATAGLLLPVANAIERRWGERAG